MQGEAYNSLGTLSMVSPDSPHPLKGPSNFTLHELMSQEILSSPNVFLGKNHTASLKWSS